MNSLLPALAFLLLAAPATAQCPPALLNCPANPPVFCAQAGNDPLLWNQSYWWDPVHEQHDLAEAGIPLNLSVLSACPDATTIRYTLYLDLDADGAPETIVDSDSLPGFNTVYFNNAGAGSLDGGTVRQFDHRPVLPNQKYGFALEQSISGDTLTARVRWHTEQAPDAYIDPQLPLTPDGKHRIVWTVTQGGDSQTCAYDFRIQDCQNPDVTCTNGLSVNIQPTQMVVLWFSDLLQSASDNITPTSQLEYGVRRSGAGAGFPENPDGTPVTYVQFTCNDLGLQLVEVWARDRSGNAGFCETYVIINDNLSICGPNITPDICIDHVCSGYPMEDVGLQINGGSPGIPPTWFPPAPTGGDGCASLGPVPLTGNQTIQPVRDNDPLNGVSTFDLLLINKHILGIQPFTAPWQLLAADANNSRSVTTFDIVEIRKVILGLYQDFPHHQSWGFVPKDAYAQLALANPFQSPIPNSVPATAIPAAFWGYKVGDVNCNAISSSLIDSDDRSAAAVSLPDLVLHAGETVETPLVISQDIDWLGFQMALAYDPDRLDLTLVRAGDLPGFDEQAYAQPSAGSLTLSWFDLEPLTRPAGAALLTLRWRAKSTVRLADAVQLEPRKLAAEAYTDDERVQPLALWFGSPGPASSDVLVFHPQPNPTAGESVMPVWLPADAQIALRLFDPAGRLAYTLTQTLPAGTHRLSIPADALLSTGVYSWQMIVGERHYSGKLVRL